MPSPFTTVENLALSWRELVREDGNDEVAAAGFLIDRASALIRQKFPSIDADVTAGRVDASIVAMVCENIVRRYMSAKANPEGVQSTTKSVINWSETVRYATPGNGFDLDEYDEKLLRPAASRRTGTIRVSRPRWC